MKFFLRALVSVLLLLGIYVLAAVLLVLGGVAVWEAAVHGLTGVLVLKLGFLALGLGVAVLTAFWRAARTRSEAPGGLLLEERHHPVLWAETRDIAATIGTRAPDEIRLVPTVNAGVWEQTRLLGLVAGRRVMILGAPLAEGLTRQQLRSVLAHELGHYSHRHTALSPIVYRGTLTLGHIVSSLGEDSWTGRLFAAYGRLYLRVSAALTRQQEVEADGWSHRIAGREAAAQSMREVPALDGIWDFFLEHYAFAVPGARPDAILRGFGLMLQDPHRQQQMAEFRRDLPEEPHGPYDSHPSASARVAWFEAQPDDGVVDDGTPARSVLGDPDATYLQMEAALFGASDLEPHPWEWIAHASGELRSRAGAAMLVRASEQPGSGAATLRDALVELSAGGAHSLVRPYVQEETPAQAVDGAARRMVTDLVAVALVDHCDARFGVEWDGEVALLDDDGQPVDVAGLVSATVDEGSAEWLVSALEDEGVPPSYSIDVGAPDQAAGREPRIDAVSVCSRSHRMYAVVVAEHALVVRRLGRWAGWWAASGMGSRGYQKALRRVMAMPPARLLDDPGAEVLTWDSVQSARLTVSKLKLVVDGRTRKLWPMATAGNLGHALREHLGPKLVLAGLIAR